MTAPIVTIVRISQYRISSISGKDQSIVTFICDQDINEWVARAGGTEPGQGLLVGRSPLYMYNSGLSYNTGLTYMDDINIPAGTEITFEVDDEELAGEGQYRINVYAKNHAGEWTPYAS